jgi:hypothetical protein
VAVLVAIEWTIVFHGQLSDSIWFLRLDPAAACGAGNETKFLAVKLWVLTLIAQAILCGAAVHSALGAAVYMSLSGDRRGRGRRVLVIVLRLAALAVAMFLVMHFDDVRHIPCGGTVLNVWGTGVISFVAAALCAVAMWMVEARLSTMSFAAVDEPLVARFTAARQRLQLLLSLSSGVLVFGVAGILVRQTTLTATGVPGMPAPQVLVEAIEYSLLLFLAYAPAHVAVNHAAHALRAAVFPPTAERTGKAILEWLENTGKADAALLVTWHDWKTLGPGFAVLAPLILGMAAHLLEKALSG